jgi:cell fate regulator YaaT (PSP1 superfamily)
MRQIGSRDEAKLLGDVESCGQRCCCIRFLKSLKPVNMRMAKLQKATLDPSKISGYCGRLKCCLRYEDQIYTELKHLMPPRSTRVKTRLGMGKVIDYQILAQLLVIELDNGTKTTVPRTEAEIISQAPLNNVPEEPATDSAIDSTTDSAIDSATDSDSDDTNQNEPPIP